MIARLWRKHALDAGERADVWYSMRIHLTMAAIGIISAICAQLMPFERAPFLAPLPGRLYGGIGLAAWVIGKQRERAIAVAG